MPPAGPRRGARCPRGVCSWARSELRGGRARPGGGAAPAARLHGARFIRRAAGEELLGGGDGGAAHPRAAAAAGAVLHHRPHRPHGRGPQLRPGQPCRQGWLEGGHHLGGGAAAAPHGGIGVSDQDGVEGAGGLRVGGAQRGVLHGLQRVQHHVGSLLGRVLPLQLPQLVQRRAHGLLDVLQAPPRKGGQHRGPPHRDAPILVSAWLGVAGGADRGWGLSGLWAEQELVKKIRSPNWQHKGTL